MNIVRALFFRKWIIATIFVLFGTVLCVGLGIWQLDRLAQRQAFNQHYLEITMSSPLNVKVFPKVDMTTMEYRLISVTGIFDQTNNIVVRNQFHDGQPGYFLLTPLVLTDGTAIIIERGWIPAVGNSNPSDWHQYDEKGLITINGIIRLGQAQPGVGGIPDPLLTTGQNRLDFWNQINLERIAQQVPYKLAQVYVQPNPEPVPASPPYPYQPVIEISDGPHLGYAIQWFIFASILVIGYPFFLQRQLTHRVLITKLENEL